MNDVIEKKEAPPVETPYRGDALPTKKRKKKGAEEEPVTGPECSYQKKVGGPAAKLERPDPEKTRAVVESVA